MARTMTHLAPEIERLIERQLRNWELARSQRPRTPSEAKPIQDFVAISRQAGSGGAEIGGVLAEKLGWPLFDKEILHAMAGDDAVRGRIYESMDERDANWLEQMLEILVQSRFGPYDYFPILARTVLALARVSPAIFLGRAADLILPHGHGLRVRVVAPLEQRMQSFAQRNHVNPDAAAAEVSQIDRERAHFIHHHFHRNIDDPTRCDLTINTAHLSRDEAVDIILAMLGKRGIGTRT